MFVYIKHKPNPKVCGLFAVCHVALSAVLCCACACLSWSLIAYCRALSFSFYRALSLLSLSCFICHAPSRSRQAPVDYDLQKKKSQSPTQSSTGNRILHFAIRGVVD
jgi:hypothetical protein